MQAALREPELNRMLTEQEKTWIERCAGRLRLVQADMADLASEKRREFLNEEISRKLMELPERSRKRYLEALLAQFPVHGQLMQAVKTEPAISPETKSPPPQPEESFEQLLERFLQMAAKVPEVQRMEVAKRLVESGLAPSSSSEIPTDVSERLRKELGLPSQQELTVARVAELVSVLVEMLGRVDQAGLTALRQVSPQNPLLKTENVRRALARFVQEGPTTGSPTRAFESMIGAMLRALLDGGTEFGRHYLERMSPEMIWEVVKVEGKPWENKKNLAWERYRELADDYSTPEQINKRVKEALGATIDSALNR